MTINDLIYKLNQLQVNYRTWKNLNTGDYALSIEATGEDAIVIIYNSNGVYKTHRKLWGDYHTIINNKYWDNMVPGTTWRYGRDGYIPAYVIEYASSAYEEDYGNGYAMFCNALKRVSYKA